MKKLSSVMFWVGIFLMVLAFCLSNAHAQPYTSRYFHYNQYFDAPYPFSIMATTTDGADNNGMQLCGGGACGMTRGGRIFVYGNEVAGSNGAVDIYTGDAANSSFKVSTNGAWRLTIPYLADVYDSTIKLGPDTGANLRTPNYIIQGYTGDGYDDGILQLSPAGAVGSTRGGNIKLYGNEVGSSEGQIQIEAGATARGHINLLTYANGNIGIYNRGLARWTFSDNSGDFTQDATNGGNVVLRKASTTVDSGTIAQDTTDVPFIPRFHSFGLNVLNAVYGSADANGTRMRFYKSRATDGTANTVVVNADAVGELKFYGADGASFAEAAILKVEIDGTPGSGDMPGRIVFMTTPDGAAAALTRWTIEQDGDFVQSSVNGGNIIQSRASTGILSGMTSLHADVTGLTGTAGFNYFGTQAENIIKGTNDAGGAAINFIKSRATDGSADVVVQSGDYAGTIKFFGADGAAFQQAGQISGIVDGTPGASDMPGRLEFMTTTDGEATVRRRWSMMATGNLEQDVTYGGHIIMTKADTYVASGLAPSADLTGAFGIPGIFNFDTSNTTGIIHLQGSNDANATAIGFAKSRKTDGTADTIVANQDNVGTIEWRAADGASFRTAAQIKVQIDGAPGASDMPGRLMFFTTPDGSIISNLRWTMPGAIAKSSILLANNGGDDDITASILVSSFNGDGHDEGILRLGAGGDVGNTRGATIYLYGNDYGGADTGGTLILATGDGTNGYARVQTQGNDFSIYDEDRNGADMRVKTVEEELTIAVGEGAAGHVTGGNLCPSGLILGINARVTQAPGGGATTYDIGCTGSGNLDQFCDGLSTALGTTCTYPTNGDGTNTIGWAQKAATTATVTTDANVTVSDMKVRVITTYIAFTAPAS